MTAVCPPSTITPLMPDGMVTLCRGCGGVFILHSGRWRELTPIEQLAFEDER